MNERYIARTAQSRRLVQYDTEIPLLEALCYGLIANSPTVCLEL